MLSCRIFVSPFLYWITFLNLLISQLILLYWKHLNSNPDFVCDCYYFISWMVRSLSATYTVQEIQQWREARKKNHPFNNNIQKVLNKLIYLLLLFIRCYCLIINSWITTYRSTVNAQKTARPLIGRSYKERYSYLRDVISI